MLLNVYPKLFNSNKEYLSETGLHLLEEPELLTAVDSDSLATQLCAELCLLTN
jgi:hypothetical protein